MRNDCGFSFFSNLKILTHAENQIKTHHPPQQKFASRKGENTIIYLAKVYHKPTTTYFSNPLMNPSPLEYKKNTSKKTSSLRARAIYHPSYTFSSTQYRRYNTASALPPGGDPSQHVRVLKATFHHRGTRHFFARALVVGVFVFFVVLMRVVGFQWV